MTNAQASDDFYADTFEEIDGKLWLFNSKAPARKCEVTNLLDADGDETDDPEIAVGGVVKIADGCYKVFTF